MRATLARLIGQGLVSDAAAYLRSQKGLPLEERVLRCELELLASNREEALSLADEIIVRETPSPPVVRALVVAGRVEFYLGRTEEGRQRFSKARALADKLGDPSLIAGTMGSYLQALLRYDGFEAAVGYLGNYRRMVTRAGRATFIATMHRILAESEIRSGRSHRALRELDLASHQLDETSDLVTLAELAMARSAAHGLLGEVLKSYNHATQSRAFAESSGAHALVWTARLNMSHMEILLARHEEAAESIRFLAPTRPTYSDSELNRQNSLLMLLTALRDHEAAATVDATFGPIAESRNTVAAMAYGLARASYFASINRAQDVVDAWKRQVGDKPESLDLNYADRFGLVAAEALWQLDRKPEAGTRLEAVALGPHGQLPEFAATVQRISGRLASDSPVAAFDHFARAARIFGHVGHIVGRGESLHNAATFRASLTAAGEHRPAVPHITTFYTHPPASFGRVDTNTAVSATDAAALTVRAASAVVDLAAKPALSAYELLTLVSTSGAAEASAILARSDSETAIIGWTGGDAPDQTLLTPAADAVTFDLGTDNGRDVTVVARPRNLGAARTTLLALQRLTKNAVALNRAVMAESERSAIWPEPLPEQQLGFVCASESMLQLLSATRRVAASNVTVLVTGETGTGKELLAKAIHNCSARSKRLFQPFNCTAVPRDMLDSQLFGYRRGAFTGAHDAFAGVIRSAEGGTLLLDEIGEISPEVQPKLLRFLESSEVHPLGEPAPVSVDVRVVAATNANLEALVEAGKFREDLFYRLNVVRLSIPPLRDRREEIPLLLEHFLERTQKEFGKSGVRIGEAASEYLLLYNWPGNVRELANEVRRAVALAEPGAVLMPEHLSPKLAATRRTVPSTQRAPEATELVVRRDQPLVAAVEHVERALIQDALRSHANVEDAARALGLSRKGLYLKRQRLKIDD